MRNPRPPVVNRFDRIADWLCEHGPSTTLQIAAGLGINTVQASNGVTRAHAYGYIVVAGRERADPGHFKFLWAAREHAKWAAGKQP
jgi:hypothetical protein